MATQPTIQTLTDPRFNDVVLWESFVGAGVPHSRDVVNVQLSSTTTLKQGSILWRAKSKTATATWDVVNDDTDVSTSNEYAILIGDDLQVKETVDFTSGVSKKAIAIVRTAHIKEGTSKTITTGFGVTATEWNNLKRLLAVQDILVNDTYTAIAP